MAAGAAGSVQMRGGVAHARAPVMSARDNIDAPPALIPARHRASMGRSTRDRVGQRPGGGVRTVHLHDASVPQPPQNRWALNPSIPIHKADVLISGGVAVTAQPTSPWPNR